MTVVSRQKAEEFALPTSERIAFGVGSLATATYAVVPGLVLLYYLTDVLGVTAALASVVVFLVAASLVFGTGVSAVIVLPAITETVRFEVACAACLVGGIGLSGVQLLLQAMLADTLAVDAAESGRRRAGVLSGLWSAAETVSAAAGAGIYGLVLAASGFISSASDESIVQPRSAEWGIVFGFSGISVLAVIAALALLAGYTLTEDQAEELVLARQHEGRASAPTSARSS